MSVHTRNRANGFTIIELLVTIAIVAILIGLLLVVGKHALALGRGTSMRQTVLSITQGIEQFKQDHRFLPPLAADEDVPGVTSTSAYPMYRNEDNRWQLSTFNFSTANNVTPGNRHRDYLRGYKNGVRMDADSETAPDDHRWSAFSLGIYLAGAGDVVYSESTSTPKAVFDGMPGPGGLEPNADGTFAQRVDGRSGKQYKPRFDDGRGGFKVFDLDTSLGVASKGRVEIRDRNGVAVRYYRWLRGDRNTPVETLKDNSGQFRPDWLNIPKIVGTYEDDALKSAEYAVVCAGQDGVFGDLPNEAPNSLSADQYAALASKVGLAADATRAQFRDKARQDNVVEAGR